MDKLDADMLGRIAREMTDPQRLQDGAALAGKGLQMPMASLRTRAARRELARIEARAGGTSPEAQAQAALVTALAAREGRISDDFARRSAPTPVAGAEEAGLSGRITRDGVPLPGMTVLALGEKDQPLRQTCTGREGRYALALPAATDLRLELRAEGKAIYRDATGFAYPPQFRGFRDIEIGKADPVCTPTTTDGGDAVQMPDLIGLRLDEAQKTLRALGLKPGEIDELPSEKPGIVLAQKPAAGEKVTRGKLVTLQVGAKDDRPSAIVGDLKGGTLGDGLAKMAETNVAVASVTLLSGTEREATVTETRSTASGEGMHLSVAVAEDDGARMKVAAALLASSEEGRAIGLEDVRKAESWLAEAKIGKIAEITTVAGENDAVLRKRLSLGPRGQLTDQRRALLSLATRLREG
jgi:hypothetical protein